MSTQISSVREKVLGIVPEFIREVEDELSGRLGQPVALVLVPENDTIAVKAESELFAGESIVVMDAGPLLSRKRVADWADAFEQKIDRLARRADDVKRLYAAIQKSPSPEKTGEIVLKHIRRRLPRGARRNDRPRQRVPSPQPGPQLRSASGIPAHGAQASPRWRDRRYVGRTCPGRGTGKRS